MPFFLSILGKVNQKALEENPAFNSSIHTQKLFYPVSLLGSVFANGKVAFNFFRTFEKVEKANFLHEGKKRRTFSFSDLQDPTLLKKI